MASSPSMPQSDSHEHDHSGVKDTTPLPVHQTEPAQLAADPHASSGRDPYSAAARKAYLSSRAYLGDESVTLPAVPRGLDLNGRISWAQSVADDAQKEWARTWEYLADLRESVLPDAAGKAAVGQLERLEKRLRLQKEAADRLRDQYQAQWDAEANRDSIGGYETRQQSLLARAARENKLA
jgi:hypothetical protein